MTIPEPTNAEVMRRLDELLQRIIDLTAQLRTDYVRKDVYDLSDRALREDIRELTNRMSETEKRRAEDRRLLLTTLIAPILVALISLYIATKFGGSP